MRKPAGYAGGKDKHLMGGKGSGRKRKVEEFRPAEDKPKRPRPKDYPAIASKMIKTSSGCRFGE